MRKIYLLFLMSAFLVVAPQQGLNAQINRRGCATVEYNHWLETNNPGVRERRQQIETHTQQFVLTNQSPEIAVTIPVVFHVLYNTAAQNISDAQCLALLSQLNLDYSKTNSDIGSVPAVWTSLAANTEIQFCLAQRDPAGNATTGIIHKSTTVSSFPMTGNPVKFSAQGGDDAWDASKYLNIWVCNLQSPLLGYAQFPGGPATTDGVVLLSGTVGSMLSPGTAVPYHLGRTVSHEVGHWLNLYHIWGDDGTSCSGSDLVDDTPNQADENYGCPTFPSVSCSNGPNGDMFMNYMDYTDDACMFMFTLGQKARMQALFGSGGARESLLTSNGCMPVSGFAFGATTPTTASCPAPSTMNVTLPTTSIGGFSADITLSATSGVPSGTTVSFSANPVTPGASTIVTLNNANTLVPGTYNITIQGVASGAPNQTTTVTFTVNAGAGPSITTQPVNQTVCAGATANFSVVATGTYQWQVNTGSGFTNISGATSASYTTAATTASMNGYSYRCIVSGQCGSTTSASATLTVNTVPVISVHPVSQAVCAGSAVIFSVTATGSGLTYQWQENTGSGFADIAGANASSYNLATTTVGQNGYQYRCVVSGTCTPPATSNAATLNVSSTVTVATNPSNSTVCELTNTSFTVAASGTGLTYQWQVSTDGGTNYTNLSATAVYGGVNASTLTLTAVPYTYNTYRYRCVVSSGVCTPGVSTAATLTVNTLPNISAHPANATICEGAANTFSVTATTGIGALTYQWQLSTNGGSTWGNITGATAATYAQASIPAGQNGYRFRVIVTAGCGSVTSNVAVLTVNTYPVITFGDIPSTICVSDGDVSLSASPAGGTWSGSGVTGSIFTPSSAGVGAKSVSYSVTNAGCTSNQSKVITVLECAERHRLLTDYLAVFVYPVPNNGNFSIRMNTDLYKRLGVRVFGADGRMYHSQVVEGIGYGSVIPVDLSRLGSGVYSLHLYNDEKDFIFKGVNVVIYK